VIGAIGKWIVVSAAAVAALGGAARAAGEASAPAVSGEPPEWAYPLNRDGPPKRPADDGVLCHVPGSTVSLPLAAIFDRFGAVDWRPDSHPPMPDVVAHGRKPDVNACGFCHYPSGQGRPENASLAGLSAAYIVQQMEAFRSGQRRAAQPAMLAPPLMVAVAAHASPEEAASAADYFSALRYRPWIRVVETDTVPRTAVSGVSMLAEVPGGGTEAIGDRIIEVPEDRARTELRDDTSGFVAYVPVGSIARGNQLAHAAKGARMPCVACHGPDLKGTAVAPMLAGRSPSYLFRQLFDIRQGSRTGPSVAMMQPEVAGMTDGEMLAIVAYLASLSP
jgi:cytochrome c553